MHPCVIRFLLRLRLPTDECWQIDFEEFCAWMMGMHPKAKLLRSQLSSNVLGGLQLDDFISEEELEALEACVAALLLAGSSLYS